jgi:aryl-alcohol dehydrogenase-like predicted oxidoreductase
VEDFSNQGPMWETCMELREAGLVHDYFLELFISCSQEALRAVERNLFDGYAFYYSIVDREITNELAHMLRRREAPIISIRTVGGGKIFPPAFERMRREEPDHYYLERIADLEPIFERSQSRDWLDFALRFLLSQPNVCTTVGGTASKQNLQHFVEASAQVRPLSPELVEEIHCLHDRWMKEF